MKKKSVKERTDNIYVFTRVSKETKDKIKKLAQREGHTISSYVRHLVNQKIAAD